MKKVMIAFVVIVIWMLSGCSAVNQTVDYVDDATEYVGKASVFADEVPTLVKQAANDANAQKELESSLKDMKQEIQDFKEISPPKVVAGLHQQIEVQSVKIEVTIDNLLQNLKNGTINPNFFENAQVVETINKMTSILNQIKKLNQ